jgi:hypothetical protein
MPITFTEGLTPDFPEATFGSELDHIKLLYNQVNAGEGYVNVLQPGVDNLVTKIDSRSSELTSAKSLIQADITTLEGYLVVPTDPNTGLPLTDPITGDPLDNIPDCWQTAGHTSGNISSIISALNGIVSNIDTAINTILPELKTEINTVDIDNFKLHMDLLSGVRETAPIGIIKPNNPALMGLVRAVTDIEHRFGITFTNYLVLIFETLFIGDLTITNTQTDLDADPLTGTYAALNVVGRVNACPPELESNAPTVIISDINIFSANLAQWNIDVAENKPIFEQHVIDDTVEHDSLQDKLSRYIQAYGISAYIQEPYYAFMYTDIFGSPAVVNIINQLQAGEIT